MRSDELSLKIAGPEKRLMLARAIKTSTLHQTAIHRGVQLMTVLKREPEDPELTQMLETWCLLTSELIRRMI